MALTEIINPSLPGLVKITKTGTTASLAQNVSETVTITFDEADAFIVGVPAVTTSTSNATVELVNGGVKAVKVKGTNTQAGAQAVAISVTAYAIRPHSG